MRKAFTLVEMIAVLIVLSILVLIVAPVMTDLLYDFEQKSNTRVFEQMYKAGRLYYAENRGVDPALNWATNDISGDGTLMSKTYTGLITNYYGWVCISDTKLVDKGYIKKSVLEEVKYQIEDLPLDVSGNKGPVSVIMFSKKVAGVDKLPVIVEYAIKPAAC